MNILLEALRELNEEVSTTYISTYVDTIDHFIDCLSRSGKKGTAYLYTNPKQGTAADYDVLGNHVCFSSDLYAEPSIMNKFNFGFILDKEQFEKQLTYYKKYNDSSLPEEDQIYGKLISYHDLERRMSKEKGKTSPIHLKALREKTDGTYEVLIADWFHWRKISKELFNVLESTIINQSSSYDEKHCLYEFPENASEDDKKLNPNLRKLYLYGNFSQDSTAKVKAELGYFPSIQNNNYLMHGPRLVNYEIINGNLKHIPLVFNPDSPEYKELLDTFNEHEYRVYIPKHVTGAEREYITIFPESLARIVLPQTYNDVNVRQAFIEHRFKKQNLVKLHKNDGHSTTYKKLQELFDLLAERYEFSYWWHPSGNNAKINWLWDSQKYANQDDEMINQIAEYDRNNPKPKRQALLKSRYTTEYKLAHDLNSEITYYKIPNWQSIPDCDEYSAIADYDGRRTRITSRMLVICRKEGMEDKICIIEDGKHWELPGGGLDRNESPKQAAIRELREETGIVLSEDQVEDSGIRYIYTLGTKFFENNDTGVPEEDWWTDSYNYIFTAVIDDIKQTKGQEKYIWKDLTKAEPNSKFKQPWRDALEEID